MSNPTGTESVPCLSGNLEQDLGSLATVLQPCGDVAVRRIAPGEASSAAALVYLSYVADAPLLDEQVLTAMLARPGTIMAELTRLPVLKVTQVIQFHQVAERVLLGETALLVEGSPQALLLRALQAKERSITPPKSENVVRGPQEAFIEGLETNLGLVRRRLPTPAFRLEKRRIGQYTRSEVAMLWLDGIADQSVVAEARLRLGRIQIDGVIDSAYLEELIQDDPYTPFPLVEHTERPDRLVAAMLEGRVGIVVDGSPFALIVPTSLVSLLQAAEDYYQHHTLATLIRWIRYLAFFLALVSPSFYIAIASIHPEMIPVGLILRLAATREGAPFPLFLEVMLMEVAFEILREAGIRLPRPVGQAVSIVGGLVVGEASVRAGVANPITIVVVALTGIASFAMPAYNLGAALRILRFALLPVAASLGIPGLAIVLMMLLTHLVSLRSFGIPYLAPLSPARPREWRDVLFRAPRWAMGRRPRSGRTNPERLGPDQRPGP